MFDPELIEDPKFQAGVKEAMTAFFTALKDSDLNDNPVLQRILEGETVAQAQGLSRDDLEVFYELGFRFLTGGELEKADAVFTHLCMIDPLEAKNHYCLGVVRQQKMYWEAAIEDFTRFLSMDATNPEGYQRLAECYVAVNHKDNAIDTLHIALAMAKKGNGPEHLAEQIRQSLENLGVGSPS